MEGDIDLGEVEFAGPRHEPRPAKAATSPELIVEEAERLLAAMRTLEEAVRKLRRVHEALREVEPCVEKIGEVLARLHE